jgi:hypothetical protein
MATANGSGQSYAQVLEAVAALNQNGQREQKIAAHEFLDKFQKSVGGIIYTVLELLSDSSHRWKHGQSLLAFCSRTQTPRRRCLVQPH